VAVRGAAASAFGAVSMPTMWRGAIACGGVEGDRAWTAGHLEQGQVVDFSSIEISLPHQGHRVDLDDLLSLEQQQVV
jgi:hypothetical protein